MRLFRRREASAQGLDLIVVVVICQCLLFRRGHSGFAPVGGRPYHSLFRRRRTIGKFLATRQFYLGRRLYPRLCRGYVGTHPRGILEVVTDKGGRVCSADAFPEGTSAVRIEFDRKGTKGSLSIDDVVVGHGYAYAPVPVEGHSGRMTGSTDTSALIDNLQSGTEYYYTVRGYDGIRFSRPSIETKAATESVSGIFSAESASVAVAAVGRCITVEAPGADIAVYDVTGRRIASGSGSLSATLPSAGVIYRKGSKRDIQTDCKVKTHIIKKHIFMKNQSVRNWLL